MCVVVHIWFGMCVVCVCEAMTHAFDQGRALFLCVLFSACSSKTISVTFKRMCANPNLVGEIFLQMARNDRNKDKLGITNVSQVKHCSKYLYVSIIIVYYIYVCLIEVLEKPFLQ